jgi:hypothetical protein
VFFNHLDKSLFPPDQREIGDGLENLATDKHGLNTDLLRF